MNFLIIVPLMSAERAWSYAMQLKFEMNSEARKKFHMINRLRKAKVHADALEQLCADSTIVDARSKLETQAYAYWITGKFFSKKNSDNVKKLEKADTTTSLVHFEKKVLNIAFNVVNVPLSFLFDLFWWLGQKS